MSKVIPKEDQVPEDKKVHLPVLKESQAKEIHLSGTAITESGTLTKHKYFEFLQIDMDDYSDLSFTPEEAKKVRGHLAKMSTGSTSMVPMICSPKCPFRDRCIFYKMEKAPYGRACQPPGTLIKTAHHGEIAIELLDENIHNLITYDRRRTTIRQGNSGKGHRDRLGYKFKKSSREYIGDLITITTGSGKTHQVTVDHICIARFNEKAVGKFCVYLMQKGDNWRVGKSQILGQYSKNNKFGHKTFLGFTNRGIRENADAMWVLGVYETNTEALLAEEFFSCNWQTPKAIFIATDGMAKSKYNGVYKWVTQEQLNKHHDSFVKNNNFYKEKLESLGLRIEYPIWSKDNCFKKSYLDPTDNKILAKGPMYIRACNLMSDIMDVPTFPDTLFREKRGKKSWLLAHWQPMSLKREFYSGLVYSLEVETYNTYFANDIATHNCLIEVNLLREWTTNYFNEYQVDPNNFTEIGMINELAEIEVYLWRLSQTLARPENADLTDEVVVGFTPKGDALTNRQISIALEAKEKLYNRKAKITKLMVGDRQEKYKRDAALKTNNESDPSNSMSELRSKIERLSVEVNKKQLQMDSSKMIDAKVVTPEDLLGDE